MLSKRHFLLFFIFINLLIHNIVDLRAHVSKLNKSVCDANNTNENILCSKEENPTEVELTKILSFSSQNMCLASELTLKESGITIPICPRSDNELLGLDNTYPSAGIFALYTGDNDNFVQELVKSYLESNVVGVFNIVVPNYAAADLLKNQDLINALNNKRVNLINIQEHPGSDRWMQDSFQFTSLNGKPVLYQMAHEQEIDKSFNKRLACLISKECNIPYYIPEHLYDPFIRKDKSTLNYGGNLEVLPGGTFITGIHRDGRGGGSVEDFNTTIQVNEDSEFPRRSLIQDNNKKDLENKGNRVLELDISFLKIAHVDEIVNVVKTSKPAPCNFAIILPSPKLAFELIEKDAMVFNDSKINCEDYTHKKIKEMGEHGKISEKKVSNIYESGCFDGINIADFIKTDIYKAIKLLNTEFATIDYTAEKIVKVAQDKVPPSKLLPPAVNMIEQNKKLIREELIKSTKCSSPEFIDLPVFFRGDSVPPNLVNAVVQTDNSSSTMIMPRTYIRSFDEYTEKKLKEYGVKPIFIHDMGYHLGSGEVHCGTNSARICKNE